MSRWAESPRWVWGRASRRFCSKTRS
jgi:hypothetical protein